MSDVRVSGRDGDQAAQLLASARARIAAASADLALPRDLRLSERQRTTVGSLLAGLVRAVEDELRAELVAHLTDDTLAAALSSAYVEIAMPVLAGGPSFADPALVDLLLRRAEEHRLDRAAPAESALLVELAGDPDEAVAREAMALLLAQNARLDGFREPVLPRTDLSAELEHHLVWTVAAALRRYMLERHDAAPADCDRALTVAAERLLARHDEGDTADARAMLLAVALRQTGRLGDDAVLARALVGGTLPLFLALLALRTGLAAAAVWELFCTPAGAVALLRAADVGRDAAASILLAWGTSEVALADALDRLTGGTAADARALLALWRADPGYRAAVVRLAQ
jgi:hypothetical protein